MAVAADPARVRRKGDEADSELEEEAERYRSLKSAPFLPDIDELKLFECRIDDRDATGGAYLCGIDRAIASCPNGARRAQDRSGQHLERVVPRLIKARRLTRWCSIEWWRCDCRS